MTRTSIYKRPETVSFIFISKLFLTILDKHSTKQIKRVKEGVKEIAIAIEKLLVLVVLLSVLGVSVSHPKSGLNLDYYRTTCSDAEAIVSRITNRYVTRRPSFAAGLLRMYFHDCFVRGCDGSILLKSPKNDAERDAVPNLSLRGFEVVDAANSALEKKCPGVVSCADVLVLVARDAVVNIEGPWWPVPLGRRDGLISRISEVDLPSPFSKRIYNFTGKGDFDPSMKPSYVRNLRRRCKPTVFTTMVDMDPGSGRKFDSYYFNVVSQKRGLFTSDSTLLDDSETKHYIDTQVSTKGSSFNKDFADSMVKLGFVQILTGKDGEIRKKCALVN